MPLGSKMYVCQSAINAIVIECDTCVLESFHLYARKNGSSLYIQFDYIPIDVNAQYKAS